jgi:aryl-alcohol dehydrogenase-like predicted oxidoreductase
VGVINASPLSMGMLSERGAPDWHPASAQLKERAREAAAFCKSKQYPIEKLAIQFSLGNPAIPTTLVSTASPAIIAQNIAWAGTAPDEEMLAAVREILRPVQGETWENS